MWWEAFPLVVVLVVVGWYMNGHRGQPILQIYTLITASYLNVFPAINFYFSSGETIESFSYFQWLVVLFFQLPLLLVAHFSAGRSVPMAINKPGRATLSPWLPLIFIIVLVGFWYVALTYDLFFRRLGHEGLQRNTTKVPALLLYIYRAAVETSFFVLMFLWTTLHYVATNSRYYRRYKWTLVFYFGSFLLFYIANSRMHVVLLLICAISTHPRIVEVIKRRMQLLPMGLMLAALLVGLTLLRELVLEDNFRVESDDLVVMMSVALGLIAARLDSLSILHELHRAGFDVLRFDLTGVFHSISFNLSFFIDWQNYISIKESLITSPTVFIVNRLLGSAEVDFPKSMILDVFLSFGLLGLAVTAVLLGAMIGKVQRRVSSFRGFNMGFLASLYVLPMLLEFEKEFLGLLIAFAKWIPVLVLIYWQRPRFYNSPIGIRVIASNSWKPT